MIKTIKGLFMGKKKTTSSVLTDSKKTKKDTLKKESKTTKKKKEITVESLISDGYVFLKEKGEYSVYTKDRKRVSIKTI